MLWYHDVVSAEGVGSKEFVWVLELSGIPADASEQLGLSHISISETSMPNYHPQYSSEILPGFQHLLADSYS